MIFLWNNKILWCRKNKICRFKLDDGGNFFLGINNYFGIRSEKARSCRWNSTSWAKSWILGFMFETKPIRIFFGGL